MCAVNVEDRNRLDELSRRDFVLLNVILVDEESSGAAIDKCGGAMLDPRVGRFKFNINSEGVIIQGGRDFEFAEELSFPNWVTKAFQGRRRGLHVYCGDDVIGIIAFYL